VRAKVEYNLAQILVDHGADVECLDIQKRTPFHTFFNPIVLKLAQHCTESMDAVTVDARGMTLAHYFSWTSTSFPADFSVLPNVDTLLKARDAVGRTPLHFAAQRSAAIFRSWNICCRSTRVLRTHSPTAKATHLCTKLCKVAAPPLLSHCSLRKASVSSSATTSAIRRFSTQRFGGPYRQ
jgi:hypothetical protein